jgi:nitrite reductase/ring-hydroxylating ferredoxin subunit
MRVLVGKDGDILEGRLKGVKADGRSFVVGRYKGRLYALDGKCSHAGFDLMYGSIVEGAVVCPAHGAKFDMASGQKLAHSGARDLRVYIVSLEGDDVYIEV